MNNWIGQGGLAAQWCGLADSDPTANGLLNASGSGHENNVSAQDIGLVRASASGWRLLHAVDLDADGNPDTSDLNDTGQLAPVGASAVLARELADTLFGADGNWVDVYRFRYTKTGFGGCPATTEFRVVPVGMPTLFAAMDKGASGWIARDIPAAGVSGGGVRIFHCSGTPRCVADHDQSGTIDANDLFQYINDWFVGCSGLGGPFCALRTADMDCNGVLNADDLFMFIQQWFSGC